jgi:hypothetical protein
MLLLSATVLLSIGLLAAPAEAEVVDLPVPYHAQVESWYCAEASLKMVFDYWGEEIPQHDIGDVANEREVGGTYATDLGRAARFSDLSTSAQYREGGGSRLSGYDQRTYGYATHIHQWTDSPNEGDRYVDLMDLVRKGYPVILLCWLDVSHDVTHFRVVKGFDTDTGDFLVHDPALGANLRFNMTLLVDDLWTYYERWGMVIAPWSVEVTVPPVVGPGESFVVQAKVTYPCPSPFDEVEKVYTWPKDPVATITVPPRYALAHDENDTRVLSIGRGGDADTVNWTMVSPTEPGYWTADISVQAEALVTDYAISYGWYTDRAGGVGTGSVGCDAVPPVIEMFSVAGGKEVMGDPLLPVAYATSDLHTSVIRVAISIDGGTTWRTLDGVSGGMDINLDLGDGTYLISLYAEDEVGNSASTNRSLVLDTTPPRIVMFQLAGGEEVLTTPTVQVTLVAEDVTTAIDLMALRVGDDQWGVWVSFKEEMQVTLPTDGEFLIDVRIMDIIGNVATASDSVLLDTTAPYISRFEVARGLAYTNTSTVQVVFSASDGLARPLEWSLHEETVGVIEYHPDRTIESGGTQGLDWTFQGEGPRSLTLFVRDTAGHTADATANLVVDTQAPLLTLVLNGGEQVATVSDIPVAVGVTDTTTDVARARIRVNSNTWGPWSDPGFFRRVDLGPGEGERTVYLQAQDMAGNLAEVSQSVYVDTMVPTVSVSFTKTRPGGVVMGDSSISLVFSEPMVPDTVTVVLMDNSSGVVECDLEWTLNGTELQVDPKGSLPRGSHFVLQVSGEDGVGNQLQFRGMVFGTPAVEGDDWDAVLPGDSRVVLLILALVILAVFIMAFGLARKRK